MPIEPHEVQARLAPFLATNPEATLEPTDAFPIIKTPWGDRSFLLSIDAASDDLLRELNGLRFPPRFSALWHSDSHDLEFIYAFISPNHPTTNRSFILNHSGRQYVCEYSPASSAITTIAKAIMPVESLSDTNYRNLAPIQFNLMIRQSAHRVQPEEDRQTLYSFFVRNVELDEDALLILARHINFYMRYFDRATPIIAIHDAPIISPATEEPDRYPFGPFPPNISTRLIDPYQISLWEGATNTTDIIRRFLYNFQIVEYAAFYYLREELGRSLRRILRAPQLLANLDESVRQVLDTLVEDKATDESKFNAVFQATVDPAVIWAEIEPKLSFFTVPNEFDGGCVIPPLVPNQCTEEMFSGMWIPKLPDQLRKIRNALVHSREMRQAKCILPTSRNNHALRPWSTLMSTIANQVILNGNGS